MKKILLAIALVMMGAIAYAQSISVGNPGAQGCVLISALPASPVQGYRSCVSNGVSSPTFLGTVSSTGAVVAPVFFNGSIWVYG